MNLTPSDAEVRAELLETIKGGLTTFTEELLLDGAEIRFLTKRVDEIMSHLQRASTYFLNEITVVPSDKIYNTLAHGIEDEKLILEYLLLSPSKAAILDIREALGVDSLIDAPLEQREALRAALYISHAIRFMHSQRPNVALDIPPLAGYVTADVLAVILKHPDRGEAILDYVKERDLISDEVDPDRLTEYLNGPSALAAGTL